MADHATALRRVITGDDAKGDSVVIIDGPPASAAGTVDTGGLFDIWHDAVSGVIDPKDHTDLGPTRAVLSPSAGNVKVRWFIIHPMPEGVPREQVNTLVRQRFASFDAEHHITDQSKHPAMHKTESLDVICLLQGDVSLVLDNSKTRIKPGQIVIQRGTSHGWEAHGGPALLLAVLIDRPLADGAH
jgi:hypothetical protein